MTATRQHYEIGYRLALAAEQDVDYYLVKRNQRNAAEFERGWFDALEDLSDFQTNCAVAIGRLPETFRRP